MLNLYQLQMFVTATEQGSFSAAAKTLMITQPAVSEQIASLEGRLGVQLFNRRGHRIELTPEGLAMLEPARRLLALAAETENELLARRGVLAGRLRIGVATAAAAPTLAALAGEFCKAHPQTTLRLEPLDLATTLDMLRDGELDAAFVGEEARARGLQTVEVASDSWVLLVPKSHEWGKRLELVGQEMMESGAVDGLSAVTAEQLRTQPILLETDRSALGSGARRELQLLLEAGGIAWRELRLAMELPDERAIVGAVLAGAGVGIVSRSGLATSDELCLFTIEGLVMSRALLMVSSKNAAPSRVASAWLDFVTAHGG